MSAAVCVAADVQDFKIQNIVGSCDVKFPIRLEGLSMAHGYFATVSCNEHPSITCCKLCRQLALQQQNLVERPIQPAALGTFLYCFSTVMPGHGNPLCHHSVRL